MGVNSGIKFKKCNTQNQQEGEATPLKTLVYVHEENGDLRKLTELECLEQFAVIKSAFFVLVRLKRTLCWISFY